MKTMDASTVEAAVLPTTAATGLVNDVHLHDLRQRLDLIYTAIVKPEARVVMAPFANLFWSMNVEVIQHGCQHICLSNNACKNIFMKWCSQAHVAMRLLPGGVHAVGGRDALFYWIRGILRYYSNRLVEHVEKLKQMLREDGMKMSIHMTAAADDDDDDDVRSNEDGRASSTSSCPPYDEDERVLSGNHFMQHVEEDAKSLYAIFVDGEGSRIRQRIDVIRSALEVVADMHRSFIFCSRTCETLSHSMMPPSSNAELIVMSALNDLRTRSWRRTWVLLLLGAMHMYNPLTALAEMADGTRHDVAQQPTPTPTTAAPLMNARVELQSWLRTIFHEEAQLAFVETVSIIVFKEQINRVVRPMAERALGIHTTTTTTTTREAAPSTPSCQEHVGAAPSPSSASDNDLSTRAFHFLMDVEKHVLSRLPAYAESLDAGASRSRWGSTLSVFMALLLEQLFSATGTLTPAANSDDATDASLSNCVLYQLLRHAIRHPLLRFLRVGRSESPQHISAEGVSADTTAKVEKKDDDDDRHKIIQLGRVVDALSPLPARPFVGWHRISSSELPSYPKSIVFDVLHAAVSDTVETLLRGVFASNHVQQQQQQQQGGVLAVLEAAIRCVWRMDSFAEEESLRSAKSAMLAGVKKALEAMNDADAFLCGIVNAIHNYLMKEETGMEGNNNNKGASKGGKADGQPDYVVLANHVELCAVLVLTGCVQDRESLLLRMDELMRVRLLSRPPPNKRLVDDVLDAQRRQLETEVLSYIINYGGSQVELHRMLSMCKDFCITPATNTTAMEKPTHNHHAATTTSASASSAQEQDDEGHPPTSLLVHVLDWRSWGHDPRKYLSITHSDVVPPHTRAADVEALPFPEDLRTALHIYAKNYQPQDSEAHQQRHLHWCREYVYVSFAVMFPRDGGRPTTIHGTLLLQRLFLLIASHKRRGVAWSELAECARQSVEDVKKPLRVCVQRGLLVRVRGGDDDADEERVALNYEYVRPADARHGDVLLWPSRPRLVRDARFGEVIVDHERCVQLATPVVMAIMKEKQRMSYPKLFTLVQNSVQSRFVLTRIVFKAAVEDLIDRRLLARIVEENGIVDAFSPSSIIEYVP